MLNSPSQFSVYWFSPEPTKGSEIGKVRPCIVVSPDEMNSKLQTVLVVPLTSKLRPWPFRVNVSVLDQSSSAACDQLRAIDKRRLKAYIGALKQADKSKLYSLLQTIFSE